MTKSRLWRLLKKRWDADGTKMLGSLQGIVAGWIAIPGLIPPAWVPWVAALNVALAAFTVRRGYTNSATQAAGQG